MILRPPLAGELPLLSALCLRSKAYWGYDRRFLEAVRAELSVTAEQMAGWPTVVADDGGSVSGVAQISVGAPDAFLEKLFVDPEIIGQGVGRMLLGWAADTAREKGCRRLIVESDPGAAGFYRRLGAIDDGVAPSASIPGRLLPRLVLEL